MCSELDDVSESSRVGAIHHTLAESHWAPGSKTLWYRVQVAVIPVGVSFYSAVTHTCKREGLGPGSSELHFVIVILLLNTALALGLRHTFDKGEAQFLPVRSPKEPQAWAHSLVSTSRLCVSSER